MCGIAGILDFSRPVDQGALRAMTGCLAHRGPDASDLWFSDRDDAGAPSGALRNGPRVGLGHRRLAILDLSDAGLQPMHLDVQGGRLSLVYNGEIYNFRELRAELMAGGHRFVSGTDTEVLLHGWQRWGEDLLPRLRGMFAFALWDSRDDRLYLARDQYGKKPLYYRHIPGGSGFAFASESRAFAHLPGYERELDLHGVSRYLLYEYVPAPHTLFRELRKLRPGHLLRVDSSGVSESRWWDIDFSSGAEEVRTGELDEKGVLRRLDRLVHRAVASRLVSDVPLGVFLSGGVDSSTILSYMARERPAHELKTFSIGFTEPSFDESVHARTVAEYFGTDHSELILDFEDLAALVPEVWAFMDDPIGDASLVPTYALARHTRHRVTVALGGDGGDEVFAGYDPFLADLFASWYAYVPRPLHRLFKRAAAGLPVSFSNISLDFKIKQFLKGMDADMLLRAQYWMGSYSREDQQSLLAPEVLNELGAFDPADDVRRTLTRADVDDRINRLIYYYSRFYLADCILPKVDRASMAVSLEVRSPFLDRDLVRFVNGLPSRFKMRGTTRKWALKKLAEQHLPREIVHRKKKGFGIPVARLLHTSLNEVAREAFSREHLESVGLFNASFVERLATEHFEKKRDHRKVLWTLLCFLKWLEHHG